MQSDGSLVGSSTAAKAPAASSEDSMLNDLSILVDAATAGGWRIPRTLRLSNDGDETNAAFESNESRSEERVHARSVNPSILSITRVRDARHNVVSTLLRAAWLRTSN